MVLISKQFSWRDLRGSHRLMLLIIATLGLLNFFFGEVVPAGGGFGWDGVTYARMVRSLDSMISNGLLSNYYAQRILPAFIVRSALIFSGSDLSDINIIRAFQVYNLALLLCACAIWRRLADHFAVGVRGRWLGFGALFLNFQSSKQVFYYPVLTDTTALLLGLLLLLCYVRKWPIALLVTAIFGAFTWQVAGLSGALLLLFMDTSVSDDETTESYVFTSSKFVHVSKVASVALLAFSIVAFGGLVGLETLAGEERTRLWHLVGLQNYLTSLPSLFGAFLALLMLVGSPLYVARSLRSLKKARPSLIALSLAALLIPWLVVRTLANPAVANAGSVFAILRLLLAPAWGKFLLPLVSLVVYLGPMALLLLLNWRAFCLQARKLGLGFIAVVSLCLPLILATESRFITLGWPFFVLGGVLMMEQIATDSSFKYLYPLITILLAQFWIKLNLRPWPADDYADLTVFPKQMYFMHHGPWMAWWPFAIQAALVGCCLIWLQRSLRPAGRAYPDLGETRVRA